MEDRNRSRIAQFHLVGYVLAFLLLVMATAGTAQVRIFPTPTPTPQPKPQPTPTPPPSTSPTPQPSPSDDPLPTVTEVPGDEEEDETPTPPPSASPSGSPKPLDELPPELEQPTLIVPNIARTRPRNTGKLVGLLEPLTDHGMPLEQVLVEGMGRFPVAGVAYYRDDWLNPRYNPTPHLHKGLDIFSDFGTPIRAPDKGVITRMTNNAASGGIGTWLRGTDGTAYYFAHQLERVAGLRIGQRVDVGTVIGYVGDTGNALGGAPHLHFEIHRGGPIPPKPSVDKWLDEAEELAPRWVAARRQEIDSKRKLLSGPGGEDKPTQADLETSMLLTLLDPVGGSVGLLPRLELAPVQRARVSSGLLLELIRLRLDGYLFVPSSNDVHLRD